METYKEKSIQADKTISEIRLLIDLLKDEAWARELLSMGQPPRTRVALHKLIRILQTERRTFSRLT